MAISDAYASVEEYKAVAVHIDAASDDVILTDLLVVSRYMEGLLHRFFTNDAAVVNRVYYPSKTASCLYIDDVSTLTGLVLKVDTDSDGSFSDETAWTIDTDFEMWPKNADKGPEPQPWGQIVIPSYSTKSPFSPTYPVQVTARFGWPTVPAPVKRACIELTRILRIESPRATSTFSAEMGTVLGTNARARNIIDDLTKSYGKVIFA